MPRSYVKKQRPTSYYSAKGIHHLQKALLYLEKVGDLKGSQTLADLQLFVPIISEFHTEVLMREQGIRLPKQTKLETPDPEILKIIKEAET